MKSLTPEQAAALERVKRTERGTKLDEVYGEYYKKLRLSRYIADLEVLADVVMAEHASD